MDEKLLARLQKDLDGFTAYYDGQLNKTLASHAQNMMPLWKHVEESLLKRAKQLYGEADALDENLPPITRAEKFRALKYEASRLENLAADMAEDIKKAETKLQPYFTSNIAHEFEKGYYFTNWGLEQALKVSVQTPLLTPNRIYGVLANPWLPDGKTYSARLRMNTTYLAGKMRGAMAEAVSYGWGWNEAARRIQEVAQEGYFNSVRLARTEMVRASNLGASYSYMQNSDILDGKRWNATLDQKTAPKDADNDGEIFDLDYDTPENPAVPGKRIPNHPNCRCRYTPVISALGVQKEKGRIAKDPKDKSREYFKGNYREYAKFKNLPDLDERLKAENPARYLRPGEKLEDLNKQVVRRTVNNREITIPRPMWERLEKPPASIPPIVEPTAATVTNVLGKLPVNKNSSIYQKVGEGHYNNIQAVVEKAPQDVRQVWAKFESKLTFIDVDSWEHPHCNYGRNRGGK
jgi:SPP1 gp7 family putative phage head morphogenesis protein